MEKTTRQVDIKALISHIVRGDGADRCRICMGDTAEGQVHLEDTVMMDGDRPVTLAELLEVITGVEIEPAITLPSKICSKCVQDLTAMLPFIKLCRNSAKRWTDICTQFNNITVPKNTKNLYIEVAKDIRIHTDSTKCRWAKINTKQDALRNFKIRLYKQTTRKHTLDNEQCRSTQDSTAVPKLACPECHKVYARVVTFNKHLSNLRMKMCGRCDKVVHVKTYAQHLKTHGTVVVCCEICDETFEQRNAYLIHKKKHSGSHVCSECKQSFKTGNRLNTHLGKHKKVICGCSKKFTNRVCYFNHKKLCRQTDNIISKFICDYCKDQFKAKNTLRMHIKLKHTIGRLLQCDKCGKKFSNQGHLDEHSNTHVKIEDRFVCGCGSKYSSRRGYKRHLMKHAEED